VESTVIIKDGVSVILGGLRRDDYTVTSRGIPLLMDVPLVGNIFKNRNEDMTKTEIVIFMTPKIIRGNEDVFDKPIEIKKTFPEHAVAPLLQGHEDTPLGYAFQSMAQGDTRAEPALISESYSAAADPQPMPGSPVMK
jgi:hypothetical protein